MFKRTFIYVLVFLVIGILSLGNLWKDNTELREENRNLRFIIIKFEKTIIETLARDFENIDSNEYKPKLVFKIIANDLDVLFNNYTEMPELDSIKIDLSPEWSIFRQNVLGRIKGLSFQEANFAYEELSLIEKRKWKELSILFIKITKYMDDYKSLEQNSVILKKLMIDSRSIVDDLVNLQDKRKM